MDRITNLFAGMTHQTVRELYLFLGVSGCIILVFTLIRHVMLILTSRRRRRHKTWHGKVRFFVENIKMIFILAAGARIAISLTELPRAFEKGVRAVFIVMLIYELTIFVKRAINYGAGMFVEDADDHGKSTVIGINIIVRIILWGAGVALVLSSLGFEVSAIVASLGITSIAVAFALQSILSDIFSSFSIFFDKPFSIGDFIVFDTHRGTVEKIGIRSTRIRSLEGESIIVPNHSLASRVIRNYARIERRRCLSEIDLKHATAPAQLKKFSDALQRIVKKKPLCDYSRASLREITMNAYRFELEYFVRTEEYPVYCSVVEEINLMILEYLAKNRLALAQPVRQVIMSKK